MKNYLILFIAALSLLFSCDQLQMLQEGITMDDANKALLTQTVPATATLAQSISFKAPDIWIAEVKDASWLTVTPTYGGAGDVTLRFALEINTGKEQRTGKVVITCKGKTIEVSITQEGLPDLTVDDANKALLTQTVPATATSAQSVTFVAPLSWTASVLQDATWLTVSPTKGEAGTATVSFTLAANNTFQSRTGKVTISCNGQTLEIIINQEGLAEWEASDAKRYVKTISMQYKENVSANANINNVSYTLGYDNKKRVNSLAFANGTIVSFDYSHPGQILGTSGGNTILQASIGADDLVDQFVYEETQAGSVVAMTFSFQRRDGTIVKMTGSAEGSSDQTVDLEYADGKFIAFTMPDGSKVNCPAYRFNFALPAININLNAFMWVGTDGALAAPLWFGYCGRMGDYLMEWPMLSYQAYASAGPSKPNQEDGTYHGEEYYGQLGDISDLKVEKDTDGCFTKITYYWEVDQWKYSYDYVVENGHWNIVRGSEKREPTGTKLGDNQIIYSISYL